MSYLHSFSSTIASRGYHIFMHTTWDNAYVGEKIIVQIEQNQEPREIDPYCCAIKIKYNSVWITVGHIPRELSRFFFFFIRDEGGCIEGSLLSTQYRPSPIPARGLEVPLKLNFSCKRFVIIGENETVYRAVRV